jgi:hypothetical protein
VKHPGTGITTNSGNTYSVTLNPVPTSYVDQMGVVLTINADSTGASTINVNGLGAKPIKKANGNDVTNLKANGVYTLRYNLATGNFILQGEGGEYGTALASDVRNTKTFGDDNGIEQGTLDLSNLTPSNIKKDVQIDNVVGTLFDVSTDPDWIPANIKTGVDIGGKVGTVTPFAYTAGSLQLSFSNVARNTTNTNPVLLKQMTITLSNIVTSGIFRITFTVTSQTVGWNGLARIYINDIPKGISRQSNDANSTTFAEDLTLQNGDKIQVYGWTSNGVYSTQLTGLTVSMNDFSKPTFTTDL